MARSDTRARNEPPLKQRLAWFVLLWLGGVGSVALVAAVLRYWLRA
jgi:hypothetical protein